MVDINKIYTWLTHFCRKISYVAIYALSGGHFAPDFGGRGHNNILKDRAPNITEAILDNENSTRIHNVSPKSD